MRMLFTVFHVVLVAQLLGQVAVAVDESEGNTLVPFDEKEISNVIEQTFKCHNNPGLAVSIVKDGQVLLSRGFGVMDLNSTTEVTNTTVFGVASLSKAFAATLFIKLLSEKTNLTVDSRIRDYLGDQFQMPDEFRTDQMTFADLMGHRTGIPPNNYIRFDTNLTRDTVLDRMHLLPAPSPFRVKFYYSNLMYGVITHLTEKIGGGKKWEELMTDNLLTPLGMDKTTFATVADFTSEDIAVPYIEDNGTHVRVQPEFSRRWGELAGSGAVLSTAADMTKWMHFHLSLGQSLEGQQVLKANILAEVHKPRFLITQSKSFETHIPEFPVTTTSEVYAHGFRRGYYRGYDLMYHTGSTLGYRALMVLLPQQKIGVFMAMTGYDDNYKYRFPLSMYLLDRALGLDSWLNISTICSFPQPWAQPYPPFPQPNFDPSVKPKLDPKLYEGAYENRAYGDLHVVYNKTLAGLVLSYGWGTWRLYPQSTKDGHENFFGKGIGLSVALDLKSLSFIEKIQENKTTVVGVNATGFDSSLPPIFNRKGVDLSGSLGSIIGGEIKHVLLVLQGLLIFLFL